MPLDPQAKAILEQLGGGPPLDLSQVPAAVMREGFRNLMPREPGEPVDRVSDRSVPGPEGEIPIRVYTPEGDGPHPLLVYFHGGGFVVCDLESHDGICRSLTNAAGCVTVSVDYRLAPESRFPAAPEDCFAATRWVSEHARELGGDPQRVAVAGDSAGGNLAAVVALMARERGGPALAHQLLVYPVTDHAFDTASYEANAEGYFLTRDMMRWFWGHYLGDSEEGSHPHASPLRAMELSGLPSATVVTAEYDPLRDEGEAYAERLAKAGVPTELRRYDGMIHGFFGMTHAIDRAREAIDYAAGALRKAFGPAAAR